MGKGSTELAAELDGRRRAFRRDVVELQQRIDDDLRAVREKVDDARARMLGAGGEHPGITVGAAAATGFAAERVMGRNGSDNDQGRNGASDDSPGLLRKAMGKGASAATGLAQAELAAIVAAIWKGASRNDPSKDGAPER